MEWGRKGKRQKVFFSLISLNYVMAFCHGHGIQCGGKALRALWPVGGV